jgi:ubiquinone/menaquinone biosynthesis C-methylase UbiE
MHASAYDKRAARYDRRWSRYLNVTHGAALQAIEGAPPTAVLDLACGSGVLLARLRAAYPHVPLFGVDASAAMLQRARTCVPARLCRVDAARLPVASGVFDLVTCASALHEMHAPTRALAEARRVLVPGGRLVIVDWCDDYLACRLCGLFLRRFDAAFHRAYRLTECVRMVRGAGFRIVEARRFRAGWFWGMMRIVAEAI